MKPSISLLEDSAKVLGSKLPMALAYFVDTLSEVQSKKKFDQQEVNLLFSAYMMGIAYIVDPSSPYYLKD